MSITIIIPTLKIDQALERLLAQLPSDVIIVNGEPEIYSFKDRNIINSNPGRGLQLKTGASFASGEWLLFLHGDSVLTSGWRDTLQDHIKERAEKALVFRLKFDDEGFFPRLLEYWVHFRCRLFTLPYGDQGLFISRALYDEVGGYNEMPLMEDVDIIKRIGKSRLSCSKQVIITSAEKYNKYGYLFRMIRNGICLLLYKIGVSPDFIKQIY